MRVFCYSLNTTAQQVGCLDTTAHVQEDVQELYKFCCHWGLGHLRIWVSQGVLEWISRRHSGNYPRALILSPVGGLWLVMCAP